MTSTARLVNQLYKFDNPYSNDIKLKSIYIKMDMFKNTGQKQVNFIGTVYPSSQIKSIGQVGGIDVLPNGDMLVFHRADRVWTFE